MLEKLKLGTKKVCIIKLPPEFGIRSSVADKQIVYDVLIDSIAEIAELKASIQAFKKLNQPNAILYVVYPKLSSKQEAKKIHRDELMKALSASGLKAFTLLSLSEDFSCMGAKDAAVVTASKAKRPSQCVADYIEKIVELKQALMPHAEALKIYNQLSPGYQKDWARFVYSAVRAETRVIRLRAAAVALELGHKSHDQYRQSKVVGGTS